MSTNDASYADATQDILGSLEVSLRILVWGPGETSKPQWFEKRTEVIKALRDTLPDRDTVVTSEELFRQSPPPNIECGTAELAHANSADLIIALILGNPQQQGGIYRELQLIAPYRSLRDKVWIFMPDAKNFVDSFPAGMLDAFRGDHKIPLPWKLLKTCKRLRDICISKAKEERKQRMYDKMAAYMHSQGEQFR